MILKPDLRASPTVMRSPEGRIGWDDDEKAATFVTLL